MSAQQTKQDSQQEQSTSDIIRLGIVNKSFISLDSIIHVFSHPLHLKERSFEKIISSFIQ